MRLTNPTREWLPPLVHFELARAGRAKWIYLLRFAPLVLAICQIFIVSRMGWSYLEAIDFADMFLNLTAFWLVGPIAAASAIAGQRESGTADLLELASIHARNLYGSALAVVVVQVWSVMLSVLPIAVCLGVEPLRLLAYAGAGLASAFAVASLGLLCSAYAQSAPEALMRCYAVLLGIVAAEEGLYALTGIWTQNWLRLRSDIGSMSLASFAVQVVAGLVFTYFAIRRLQQPTMAVARPTKREPLDLSSANRALRGFLQRAAQARLPLWDNVGRGGKIVLVFAAAGAMALMPFPIFLIVPLSLMFMIAETDRQRENGSFDELRMTQYTTKQLAAAIGAAHVRRWLPLAVLFMGAGVGLTIADLADGLTAWLAYAGSALHGLGTWWIVVWLGLHYGYEGGSAAARAMKALGMVALFEFIIVSCLTSALSMPLTMAFENLSAGPSRLAIMNGVNDVTAPIVLLALGYGTRGQFMRRFGKQTEESPG